VAGGPFEATLWRWPGKGGWTFAPVPAAEAPAVVGPWGRTPVEATVDGQTWATSVWSDRAHGCLLPVPADKRGGKGPGDVVVVTLRERPT
jgi:hypothetical protein